MDSRERILTTVKMNQPAGTALPDIDIFLRESLALVETFSAILTSIGGTAHIVHGYHEINEIINNAFPGAKRVVSTCAELTGIERINSEDDPHLLENIDLAILEGHLGVAENAAVWITEDLIPQRVLPFISQYLAVVIRKEDIVSSMHEAYKKIGDADYGFGTFIAGPSKTADIEQSLVLGAHGPKGMTVFIIDSGS